MRQRRAGRLGATLLLAQICCSSKVFSLQMALSGGVNVNTARVNVCTNRWCKEKGSGATLASFIGLIPDDNVLVSGVGCLGKCNKGPNIQIMHRNGTWYELNRVDSVDKVYRILTDHLQCRVSPAAAECLQHNFEGNAHLDRNEVTQAIASYNKAIDAGFKDQEGVILVMRSTAYLQRAFSHRIDVRNTLDRNADFQKMEAAIIAAFTAAMELPYWTNTMLRLILSIGEAQAETYHNLKLHHGLYEFAVLQATDDAVRATQLLPNYSKCWLRAGEALAELRRTDEALQYFDTAVSLDPSLASVVEPIVNHLQESRDQRRFRHQMLRGRGGRPKAGKEQDLKPEFK
uniref:Uncharacterized protein n=1 Tax=Pinguiococcus pyrenoidosus TaxID=172671 RepID=A0A7R9U417_9STRA|mmetsp:Transcript_1185/g.5005  ORF Transcript_1185/g.5005 Transcript_1185/m.5005 type:complete len:345 (+) Transcript_1185:88-1122(+)